MTTNTILGNLLQATLRIDRPTVSTTTALRNAVGVTVPLALGLATGHGLTAMNLAIGALIVAYSDLPAPYWLRARQMLLTSFAGALSAFVGALVGSSGWLTVVVTMVWGLGAGLLVALGPVATQIGLASVILLAIYSARPLPLDQAVITGALVFAGGAFQTLLAVAAWPFRPFGPERDALAVVFRSLAAYIPAPSDANLAPPLTAETTAAQTMLSRVGRDSIGERLRSLLDEAERIRLVLIAFDDARQRIHGEHPESAISPIVDQVWTMTGEILEGLAESLTSGKVPTALSDQLQRLDAAVQAARQLAADPSQKGALILMENLVTRLRAAVEIVRQLQAMGRQTRNTGAALLLSAFDLSEPIAVLRANLTWRSASFRHAVRLAVSLGIAVAVARGLGLPNGYWVPLTVALVLRPDFSTTIVRAILRFVGTLLGLVVAAVLVRLVFGEMVAEVLLVGVLVFAIRRFIAQNYGLGVLGITTLVVILLGLGGADPRTTIVDRGLDTLVGGVIALAIYSVWPTWERTQKPAILADLLDAYRQSFDAMMACYLNIRRCDADRLVALRNASRLARTNAEASIERLRGEPVRSEDVLDRGIAFLAASNRFIRAKIALDAQLFTEPAPPVPPDLRSFVVDVDATLEALARALREPARPLAKLPNLREDLRALTRDLIGEPTRSDDTSDRRLRLVTFVAEAERIVDSLEAMVQIICHRGRTSNTDQGPSVGGRAA
jgi:uncharacterized membrane protein YccC